MTWKDTEGYVFQMSKIDADGGAAEYMATLSVVLVLPPMPNAWIGRVDSQVSIVRLIARVGGYAGCKGPF